MAATMQGFNFGIRNSATPSFDETGSRYVPSSIYSGPGPAEESPVPQHVAQMHHQPQYMTNGAGGGLRIQSQSNRNHSYDMGFDSDATPSRPETFTGPNMNDPLTMHLLMETAIADSKGFQILSFDELQQLKRERNLLRTKVEGAKRQLALEKKMLEAAQLMNKLGPSDASNKKSSFFGRKSSSSTNAPGSELDVSSEKVERLSQEVSNLDTRLQEVDRRIMNHTAGILQSTHRGLKKNIRKNELPRSPESMASQRRSTNGTDASTEFDERSLYQVPDYVHDFGRNSRRTTQAQAQPIDDVAIRLRKLNTQLHTMIQQTPSNAVHFEPPPDPSEPALQGRVGAQIQAHLTYMSQGLEALQNAGPISSGGASQQSAEQVSELTSNLTRILERTNSVAKSPSLEQEPASGADLQTQLEYSFTILARLNQRIDTLLEQKDILTRQIQQQRELNNKSDAQKDAYIRDLTEELEEAKNLQTMSEKEVQQTQDQLGIVMEQLDQAKQNEQLLEQQLGSKDTKALEMERGARKDLEAKMTKDMETKQHAFTELQADHSKLQNDMELKAQTHLQQLDQANSAKQQAEAQLEQKTEEHAAIRREMEGMEAQVVQLQTELTMARAELDGAYGSRAERAADVSMNPEIKKQIDSLTAHNKQLKDELDMLSQAHETKGAGSAELQNKVNSLQKELKETIEDYEVMTKASIDFEKDRDRLEATIDELKEKCEGLEVQISEDQVKWLGIKPSLPTETTSMTVMRGEFKRMMRDARIETQKTIKVSRLTDESFTRLTLLPGRTRRTQTTRRYHSWSEEGIGPGNAIQSFRQTRSINNYKIDGLTDTLVRPRTINMPSNNILKGFLR